MPALFLSLREALVFGPESRSSEYQLDDILRELGRRGLDGERLIRHGFGGNIAAAISVWARIAHHAKSSGRGEGEEGSYDGREDLIRRGGAWSDTLLSESESRLEEADFIESVEDGDLVKLAITGSLDANFAALIAWVVDAPIEDVISWKRPDNFESYRRSEALPLRDKEYLWLTDRFCVTYLNEWHPGSLKTEWRYIHAGVDPPCGPQDMACRRVDREEVARVISDNECVPEEKGELRSTHVAQSYAPIALRLLRQGDYPNAARIFSVAASVAPSADAFNNWAFCLMPLEPAKALHLLSRAAEYGGSDSGLLYGNKLLCLYLLGRYTAALEYAGEIVAGHLDIGRVTAFMWSLNNPKELQEVDLGEYIADLIILVAREADGDAGLGFWERAVQYLRQ